MGEQVEVATQNDELATDQANGYSIVLAKVGDGLEAHARQVEFINEDIDDSDRAVFGNVVVESFGK